MRLATLTALLGSAAAWREYMVYLPNSDRVPCFGDAQGCWGTPRCEAFGHDRCMPTGKGNRFGKDAERADTWSYSLCVADSDGDGYTNGDELGDPCCAWKYGSAPDFTTDVSDPGQSGSRPASRGTCLSTTNLPAVSGVTAVTSAQALQVTWTLTNPPSPAKPCSCEYDVAVSFGATVVHYAARGTSFKLCAGTGVNPAAVTAVTVAAANLGGAGTGVAAPSVPTGTVSADGCSPAYTYPHWSGMVKRVAVDAPKPARAAAGAYVTLALLILSLLGGAVVLRQARGRSFWLDRAVCPYRGCTRYPSLVKEFAFAGPGSYLFLAAFLGGLVATLILSKAWYTPQVYAFGDAFPVNRAAGYALAVALGVTTMPVTRYSLWLPMLGLSFERAIRFHRWAGTAVFALTLWHGIGILIDYCGNDFYGCKRVLESRAEAAVDPLTGTIAGILIVVLTLATLVRRKFYALHMFFHTAWPAILILGMLHTRPASSTRVLGCLLPGLGLMCVDILLLLRDALLRPTSIVSASLLETPGCPPIVRLVMRKTFQGFEYVPGQYMSVMIPSISLLPHPFSISSVQQHADPSLFTLHLRDSGSPRAWTHKLAKKVRAALSSAAGSASPDAAAAAALGRMLTVGPFGYPTVPLEKYRHFMLVGGGIGITPLAPVAAALASGAPVMPPRSMLGISCGRPLAAPAPAAVHVVWAVREQSLLKEFLPNLTGVSATLPGTAPAATAAAMAAVDASPVGSAALSGASSGAVLRFAGAPQCVVSGDGADEPITPAGSGPRGSAFTMDVHLSGKRGSGQPSPQAALARSSSGVAPACDVEATPRRAPVGIALTAASPAARPDWPTLLQNFAASARSSGGAPVSVAVAACGPEAMLEELAIQVAAYNATSAAKSGVHFDLHTETFVM